MTETVLKGFYSMLIFSDLNFKLTNNNNNQNKELIKSIDSTNPKNKIGITINVKS